MVSKSNIPVMGYNTFDSYGWSVTEKEFKDDVVFIDKELKQFGYKYMCLDFMWSTPGRDSRDNPDQDENFSPWRYMDRYGRLIPAPDRFKESIKGNSLKYLADFIHDRGMKFGIHVMCGVPRQAVAAKSVIKGTDITCDKIVDLNAPFCTWNNEMYPIDFSKVGSEEYVESLIELYTSWEVDLIKIDDLSFPYRKESVEAYGEAIRKSEREIVFSTSPGATPLDSGEHVSQWANMWRISPDFWDDWSALRLQIDTFLDWQKYKKGDAIPDGDMVPVAALSNYGPWPSPRYSNFTYEEKRTLLSVWSIMNSPIILGGDLKQIDKPTIDLLQNPAITTIDKFARNVKLVEKSESLYVIEAEISENPNLKVKVYVNISENVVSEKEPENIVSNIWGNTSKFLSPHDSAAYIIEE